MCLAGAEDLWVPEIVRLTYSELAFCNHERWPKSLASTVEEAQEWKLGQQFFPSQVFSDGYNYSGDSPIPCSLSLKPL